jgi:hypothetical protein
MRVSTRTVLIVVVAVAVFLAAGISMRGQGGGLLHRLAALHGHR